MYTNIILQSKLHKFLTFLVVFNLFGKSYGYSLSTSNKIELENSYHHLNLIINYSSCNDVADVDESHQHNRHDGDDSMVCIEKIRLEEDMLSLVEKVKQVSDFDDSVNIKYESGPNRQNVQFSETTLNYLAKNGLKNMQYNKPASELVGPGFGLDLIEKIAFLFRTLESCDGDYFCYSKDLGIDQDEMIASADSSSSNIGKQQLELYRKMITLVENQTEKFEDNSSHSIKIKIDNQNNSTDTKIIEAEEKEKTIMVLKIESYSREVDGYTSKFLIIFIVLMLINLVFMVRDCGSIYDDYFGESRKVEFYDEEKILVV